MGRSATKPMYTPYLMFGYAAALVLTLLGFRVVQRSTPELRGLRYLTGFVLCGLIAVLLIASRPWLPAILTVVFANFLLLVGATLVYAAAADVLEKKPRLLGWRLWLCVLALPLLFWFTSIENAALPRLLIHAVVIAAIFATTAAMLFRQKNEALRSPMHGSAWLLLSVAALNVLWSATGILHPEYMSYLHPDAVDLGFSYLSMVLGLGNVAALLWLSLCAHRLRLEEMAQTDDLTGLLNRRAFDDILRREMQRSARTGLLLGVILIDLDYFKRVNDSLGHFAGDDVLRRVSNALREGTRPADVLARYGGEEFVVLLRNSGLEETELVAERIRQLIAELSGLPGGMSLTASIGVAVNQPNETPAELLLRSDEALYRSKREGRNLVSVYRLSDDARATPQ